MVPSLAMVNIRESGGLSVEIDCSGDGVKA